jgi:hypothetical protein
MLHSSVVTSPHRASHAHPHCCSISKYFLLSRHCTLCITSFPVVALSNFLLESSLHHHYTMCITSCTSSYITSCPHCCSVKCFLLNRHCTIVASHHAPHCCSISKCLPPIERHCTTLCITSYHTVVALMLSPQSSLHHIVHHIMHNTSSILTCFLTRRHCITSCTTLL